MVTTEINLSLKRNKFRKRRNLIRRFSLIIFLLSFLLSLFFVYSYSKDISNLELHLLNVNLLDKKQLSDSVVELLGRDNFLLVSTKEISKKIKEKFPILENVVIRKYILPSMKLLVTVQEKNIWGEVFIYGSSIFYVTDKGDLVSLDILDKNRLSTNLIKVYISRNSIPERNQLLLLKVLLEKIKKLNLPINKIIINSEQNLIIEMIDGESQICVGKIDDKALIRINRLETILQVVNERSLMIKYLDLNLDNSAILKTYSEDKLDTNKKSFFHKIMLN